MDDYTTQADDEFHLIQAIHNKHNKGILAAVINSNPDFRKVLSKEERLAVYVEAVVVSLKYYDESRNCSFTTYLYDRIKERFQRLLKVKKAGIDGREFEGFEIPRSVLPESSELDRYTREPIDVLIAFEDAERIRNCFKLLPERQRRILQDYYVDGKTLAEVDPSKFRQQVKREIEDATAALRKLYMDGVDLLPQKRLAA